MSVCGAQGARCFPASVRGCCDYEELMKIAEVRATGKWLWFPLEAPSELQGWLVSGQWYCDVIEALYSVAKVWMLAQGRLDEISLAWQIQCSVNGSET